MDKTFIKRSIFLAVTALFMMTKAHASIPVWTFSAPSPANVTVAKGETVIVQYTVTNQSNKTKTLLLRSTPGLSATPCYLAQQGSTCFLTLIIHGSLIPAQGIHTGPVLCERGNPNQCYQPSSTNQLNVIKQPTVEAKLNLANSSLVLTAGGGPGVLTLTNTSTTITALNIAADFSGTALAGHVSQDASQCISVPPGQSCTLIFTPDTTPITPVNFPIKGSNTEQLAGTISVTLPTQAQISVSGSPLTLTTNGSDGFLTVTNQSTVLTATNINAILAGTALDGNVTQDASNCLSVLPQQSCMLRFTPGSTPVTATTVTIQGSNTSQTTASIAINNPVPQASISITGGQTMTLDINDLYSVGWMVIQNNSSSITATNIVADFAGTALNGHITQDSSECASVAPNGVCTLYFTISGTTLVPATNFGVAGSNTTQTTGSLTISSVASGQAVGTALNGGRIASPNVVPSGAAACGTTSQALYLVAATSDALSDNDPRIIWTPSKFLMGVTNITDGYQNTQDIIASIGPVVSDYAAKVCNNYQIDENGNAPCQSGVCYGGWYLPAQTELYCLYNNQVAIGGFSLLDVYWSSTEFDINYADVQDFANGNQDIGNKTSAALVRCVRAITN